MSTRNERQPCVLTANLAKARHCSSEEVSGQSTAVVGIADDNNSDSADSHGVSVNQLPMACRSAGCCDTLGRNTDDSSIIAGTLDHPGCYV